MACNYYIKGHLIGDEFALDDFLLTKLPFMSKFGDLVFNKSEATLKSDVKALAMFEHGAKATLDRKILRKQYGYDEALLMLNSPYVDVTAFFKNYETAEGKILTPEFRPESFWKGDEHSKGRFKSWNEKSYTDDELALFYGNGIDSKTLTDEDRTNLLAKAPDVVDPKTQEEFRAYMEYLWEIRNRMGTEIHNILSMYFSNPNSASFDNIRPKIKDIIPDKVITDTIKYAILLHKYLIKKYGNNGDADSITIYAENPIDSIITSADKNNNDHLLGRMDLFVIDKEGNAHIFDYKTSTNHYDPIKLAAKERTYTYLLGLYARIVNQYGFNFKKMSMHIIPLEISGLHIAKNGDELITIIDNETETEWNFSSEADKKVRPKYVITGITPLDEKDAEKSIINLTEKILSNTYAKNLDEILPIKIETLDLSTEDAIQNVNETLKHWIYTNRSKKEVTEEILRDDIKLKGGFLVGKDGNLRYKSRLIGNAEVVVKDTKNAAKNEAVVFKKALKLLLDLEDSRERNFIKTYNIVKKGLDTETDELASFGAPSKLYDSSGSNSWMDDTFLTYFRNKHKYKLIENELLDAFLMIGIYNTETNQIDFYKFSTSDLKALYKFNDKKQTSLAANFKKDIEYQNNSNSFMLQGVYGNIELMEMLLVINNMSKSLNNLGVSSIGNVQVINPIHLYGLSASDKELMYCWNELNKGYKVINNHLGDKIKLATRYEIFINKFKDILTSDKARGNLIRYQSFLNDFLLVNNRSIKWKVEKLTSLIEDMLRNRQGFSLNTSVINEESQAYLSLYNTALTALAELKGITFRQQLETYNKYLLNIGKAGGATGLYTDNPGNLPNDTLNLITKLILDANQNTKDAMMRDYHTLLLKVEELKDSKDMGYFKERVKKQESLYVTVQDGKYDGMMYRNSDGNLMITNPWTNNEHSNLLNDSQKEFLKYFLTTLNNLRFKGKSEEYINSLRDLEKEEYFEAPLIEKTENFNIATAVKGIGSLFKALIHPIKTAKSIYETGEKTIESLQNTKNSGDQFDDASGFYELTNKLLLSLTDSTRADRLRLLLKPDTYFENNLEYILLKALQAYYGTENVNSIMPLVKASLVHLMYLGTSLNIKYENEIDYLNNYVKAKVKNEMLGPESLQLAAKNLGKARSVASFFMLAFAPVLYYGLLLDGIVKGMQQLFRGDAPFTRSDLFKAANIVRKEFTHFGRKDSLLELLNKLYGINDMDMNTYAERLKSDQFSFMNLAYRCASRPDFYNRMVLLVAQMIHDGSFEAYSVVNGKLVYNWKNDARFAAYANNSSDITAYNQAKGKYIAVMKQFMQENAKGINGEDLKLDIESPMDLPRAYTNLEMMSIKSMGDNLYGYYSHETKSMIQSLTIGALFMQYRTYWSGKKNLYLAPGGIKLKGHWEILEGVYEKYNEETGLWELTTLNTGIPHYYWKGDWQEGIFVTMALLTLGLGFFKELYNLYSDNSEIGKVRRANMNQFLFDIASLAIIGPIIGMLMAGWLNDEKEKADADNLADQFVLNNISLLKAFLRYPTLDLNFVDSIFGPLVDSNPVAFAWGGRVAELLQEALTGETKWSTAFINCSGHMRQNRFLYKALLD